MQNSNLPEAAIFDLDGTIYLGSGLIQGADTTIASLRSAGVRVAFLTNKPISSPEEYANKLSSLGIDAKTSDIITSVSLTIDYLNRENSGKRVFVIGERYLQETLLNAGYSCANTPEETDVVIVSLDRNLDYGKIHFAYRAVREGAHIVATNPDMICPMDEGEIVDAGAWIAALEALIKQPISDVMGKPSARCAEVVLAGLDCLPENALMVGDRLETDIRMAVESGMRSGLVLSGVSDVSDVDRSDYQPDFVWESVANIPEALGL
jgi:arabinose operon protein AraL